MSMSARFCSAGMVDEASCGSVCAISFFPCSPPYISRLTASITCCVRMPRTIATSMLRDGS